MKIRETLRGMAYVTRFPATDKQSRITTTAWAVSAACAIIGIVSNVILWQWGSPMLWIVAAVLILDVFMLRLCILGLGYRRQLRGRARRRAERI